MSHSFINILTSRNHIVSPLNGCPCHSKNRDHILSGAQKAMVVALTILFSAAAVLTIPFGPGALLLGAGAMITFWVLSAALKARNFRVNYDIREKVVISEPITREVIVNIPPVPSVPIMSKATSRPVVLAAGHQVPGTGNRETRGRNPFVSRDAAVLLDERQIPGAGHSTPISVRRAPVAPRRSTVPLNLGVRSDHVVPGSRK